MLYWPTRVKSNYKTGVFLLRLNQLHSHSHIKSTVKEMLAWDTFKWNISEELARLSGCTTDQILECLEAPKTTEHGAIALPIPRLNKFIKLKGPPGEVAKTWANEFKGTEFVTKAIAIGPFLNFDINRRLLLKLTLRDVWNMKNKYGTFNEGEGKKVVVEFSSPNIAKPFHAGHIRTTIIGSFIANIHRAMGYEVIAINYLGDWGRQYGLLAVGFKKFGNEKELEHDPIKHLYDVYVKINREAEQNEEINDEARLFFKRMEDGDPEFFNLWKRFRDLSIEKYKQMYARLNIHFDVYSGESLYSELMKNIVKELEDKNLLEDSEGAKVIDLQKQKLGVVIIKKRDGATLYITRDIAAAIDRKREYKFDRMCYVVAAQQDLHFQQLFKILETMGYKWAKDCVHINFGMVKGMSTRKGTVVFLEDILEEAKTTMHEVMKKNPEKYAQIESPENVADIVGLSAVMIQDMQARRIKDYDFDWERITSFEGDTGPYLQFAHARLSSIERKNSNIVLNPDADLTLLTENEALLLAEKISKFPDAVKASFVALEPSTLITYLMHLAHIISNAFDAMWVKGADNNVAEARILLYWSARVTLSNGLRLLGLTPLERM